MVVSTCRLLITTRRIHHGIERCRYGLDQAENYRYTPMCQYFVADQEAIQEDSFIPLDANTGVPPERIANGPLLDYLRMPYQSQQLLRTTTTTTTMKDYMELRAQEVMANDNRMHEIARQERVSHV